MFVKENPNRKKKLIIELLVWRDILLFLLYLTVVNASNGKFYWLQKFPFLFGRFHWCLNFLDIKIKNNERYEFDVHCKPALINVQKTRGANNNNDNNNNNYNYNSNTNKKQTVTIPWVPKIKKEI